MSLLEKSSSIELSRRTQPFYAKKQSYNLGQQVQIEVDLQREFLDFENSRMVFKCNATGTSVSASFNKWFASQIVKNLRVKTLAGQMIGHEIREYRAWCQMYKKLKGNADNNDSYSSILEGAPALVVTEGTPNTLTYDGIDVASDDETLQFAHKFMAHLFSIKEYYPAHFHQGLMIEFDLPSNISELFTGSTLPDSVTIDDIKYVADLVQLKPEIENEMVKMMEEQRLFADYQEVLTQENTIANNTTQANYDVVGIDGRVKAIFTYVIHEDDRNASTEEYFDTWSRNGLTSYRYKLGANYLNYESIQVVDDTQRAEQVYELVKALDLHDKKAFMSMAGSSALLDNYTNAGRLSANSFAFAVKVDKAQKNTDSTISSMIDKDRNNIRVEIVKASSGGSLALTSYTHISLDKRIQILPGSIVRNVRS